MRTVLRLVLRRAAGHRRLLAAVIVGVILAVGLMSATEIYRNALRELGVDVDLARADKTELNLTISSSMHAFASPGYEQAQELIDGRLERLDEFIAESNRQGVSSTFFLTQPGEPRTEEPDRPRSNMQFYSDLEPHISVDAGRFPTAEAGLTAEGAPLIEVAIGGESAEAFGVSLGDTFDLHPFWRDDLAPVGVTVVGFVSPIDLSEEYWGRRTDHFVIPTENWRTYLFFATEEALRDVLPAYLADLDGRIDTRAAFNLDAIDAAGAAPLARGVRLLERAVFSGIERTRIETELPAALDAFTEKQFFAQVPLLVLTLQIVAIVLYYLVMVTALLIDRQAGEVALLKSRGAGSRHILGIYGLEGLMLAVLGLAIGPPLALGAVALLGVTPAFDGLSGGELLDVRLTGAAYAWAGLGAGLAFLALLVPAIRVGRRSIVQYKQSLSRPDAQSAFHRYYLDLVIVVVAALLFFQLQNSDSLVTEQLFGDLDYDPLLLLAPAVFLVTVAIVFLRAYPLLLRAVDAASKRFTGTAVQLGLWQLMRAPLGHSRLVLLLVLATAIGMFAATFGSTLDRSFDDRAAYLAGAPLRLTGINSERLGPSTVTEDFQTREDVAQASAVIRSNVRVSTLSDSAEATVIGVDPTNLPAVAWFREDLAESPLDDLMQPLVENAIVPPGIPVPAEARRIGVWTHLTRANGGVVFIRVLDSLGAYTDLRMQPPIESGEGWRFLSATLDGVADGDKAVTGLSIVRGRFGSFSGEVVWDDLSYSTSPGQPGPLSDPVVIEDFEMLDRWEPILPPSTSGREERLSIERQNVISGRGAAQYSWERSFSGTARGIRVAGDGVPIAVLASASFLEDADLTVGDELTVLGVNGQIPIRIAGRFDLFPTFDPREGDGFLIANAERLSFHLNRHASRGGSATANEAWIAPAGDAGLASLRDALDEGAFGDGEDVGVFDTAALHEAQEEDPLTAAGWDGLLFLSFASVLLLSALGFLVSSLAAARTRALEFAILRTMGFSLRQILTVVSFEQIFVVVLAMAAGTLVGARLGILMLGFLGVTERGEDVVPPFVLATDWGTIGIAYGILGGVFLLAIGFVVALHGRLAIYRVLRLGE